MRKRAAWLLLILSLATAHAPAAEWRPVEGEPPPLALSDLDGRVHALAAYRGQVVLVNFWGTWCPPCVEEMPAMQRLADALQGRPFAILAVNVGQARGAVAHFMRTRELTFTALLDRDGQAGRDWNVKLFPTSYLVGADGRLRLRVRGAEAWDDPAVVGRVEALLPAPAAQRAACGAPAAC